MGSPRPVERTRRLRDDPAIARRGGAAGISRGTTAGLREGESDEPQLIYVAPWVDWSGYDAIHIDSLTGVGLMAAVDERQGTKAIRGGFGKWSDVEQAFDFWAERPRGRLASLSGS